MATVMEHAPAYRDLLKVVPFANRESYQTLRAYVREWTLAQRSYDDSGQHMALDSSAPMGIGQDEEKGTKRKGEKGKGKKGNGDVKEKACTDDSLLCWRGEGLVASAVTRKPSAGS